MVRFPQRQWGTPWWKETLLLHNVPQYHRLLHTDQVLQPPEIVLRGKVFWEGQMVWRTSLSQEYPPGMCTEMASLLEASLVQRDDALACGTAVPHADLLRDFGLPSLHMDSSM